ncbi:MAG: 23S rRNA (guanosine(2251)-2'-O)-methyltransferase RlmB [Lactobacillales bacterium]|jgi:23S rRNA (guanosine2251-2'-O)-methyltransferase|nr:23S rRNA (guanosine(2251)-2'-O)-methyltransferase RlmB [Lactobacillales bacterium]
MSAKNHKNSKETILFGRHPVALALENKRRHIKEIFMVRGAFDETLIPEKVVVRYVPKEQIDALAGKGNLHQNVLAKVAPLTDYGIDELLSDVADMEKAVVLLLDQVTDPHNIGAILRSAAAFNASAVIVPDSGTPDESGVLAKSASGALELIPFIRVPNLIRVMEKLKKADFWCLGMDGGAPKSIQEGSLPKKCAFVMGSEGDGMRRLTEENCDYLIKLPINPDVESLNVSNATAIALYEWNRQQLLK